MVTDGIKKAKVLATHKDHNKIWIREHEQRWQGNTAGKMEEGKNKKEETTEGEKNLFIWRARGLQAERAYYRKPNAETDKH